jgi:pSer/pThr/pTyr-binding forkhead associated (FHA) protein
MRAQLIPLDGTPAIEISKDLTLVGRKEDCDLRLNHKSVSKMHCLIVKTDGLLLLRDLGSTNGTRVNGQRVRRAVLLPNDKLSIARFKFRVFLGPDEGNAFVQEHTERLDANDVADLLDAAKPAAAAGRADHPPAAAFHPNLLPDVYPEESGSKV